MAQFIPGAGGQGRAYKTHTESEATPANFTLEVLSDVISLASWYRQCSHVALVTANVPRESFSNYGACSPDGLDVGAAWRTKRFSAKADLSRPPFAQLSEFRRNAVRDHGKSPRWLKNHSHAILRHEGKRKKSGRDA
jgi:hypothetical protein